ncbi:3-deoxy-D-manno-octulosonic acid transferase [Pseudooceanicola sp. LIPI14-2-Ac024]|uniref:3-deoxy-D-manno-octulosonic acid transferase n=1 Tax=Pseudooceanicola sp. LIPI14-2-Ac024 TaxID=3344875 RepID=UPI0035CF53B3
MARSVSLSAYLALARRPVPPDWSPPDTARPRGRLVWIHVASQAAMAGLVQLAKRIDRERPGTHVLMTCGDDVIPLKSLPENVIPGDVPPENIGASEAFLAHWKPDLLLWSNGHLRPALLTTAGRAGLRMCLVDAEETALEEARWRWLPDMSRGVISQFGRAFARTANAARRLQRLGLPAEQIEITGPLQESDRALSCNEEERSELSAAIAGRAVWLAAMVDEAEIDTVLRAHRQASRANHRLLLILVPREESQGPAARAALKDEGFRHVCWSETELPGEATQVLLGDTHGDMGLWYRLSPIAFMGSSLVAGKGGCNPYEPAALGSAILSGPNTDSYLADYEKMVREGAARIVRDAPGLAAAVTRISAPDQAAAMAHAAWALATEGAEATDELLTLVGDALDGQF